MKVNDEKPPPSIRQPVTIGVCSSSNDRRIARRREVALLQHLSSPDLRFRLRHDLPILETL